MIYKCQCMKCRACTDGNFWSFPEIYPGDRKIKSDYSGKICDDCGDPEDNLSRFETDTDVLKTLEIFKQAPDELCASCTEMYRKTNEERRLMSERKKP